MSWDRDNWAARGHDEDDYISIGQRINHQHEPEDNTVIENLEHIRRFGYSNDRDHQRQYGTPK